MTAGAWKHATRGLNIRRKPMLLVALIVTIRVYDYTALAPADLTAAQVEAECILQQAGIAVQWLDCRTVVRGDGNRCNQPLRDAGEFVLRLQTGARTATAQGTHVSLGSSLLNHTNRSGVLVTIDPGQAYAVALDAGAAAPAVLGRAIAHELGHLLLGTSQHSPSGLMRRLWSQRELRDNYPQDWTFSAEEAQRIRAGLTKELGN